MSSAADHANPRQPQSKNRRLGWRGGGGLQALTVRFQRLVESWPHLGARLLLLQQAEHFPGLRHGRGLLLARGAPGEMFVQLLSLGAAQGARQIIGDMFLYLIAIHDAFSPANSKKICVSALMAR